ncbi:MAG: gluconate 5-dehydrogenase, partial [Bacillus sp. (in: firmicutes)]
MSNLFDLSGKVAVAIGGNGVLGSAMAKGLASQGAKVAIVGRNLEKA